jgi:hypothetical protein
MGPNVGRCAQRPGGDGTIAHGFGWPPCHEGWLVWQRGGPVPDGGDAAGVPGWVTAAGAALAVAPLVAAGAGELVATVWSNGLREQAEARTADQTAAVSTAKSCTADLRCKAEVIIVTP